MDTPRCALLSCDSRRDYLGIGGEARERDCQFPIERERYLRLNRMDYLGSNGRAERKHTGT